MSVLRIILNHSVFPRNLTNSFPQVYGYFRNTYCVQMSQWTNLIYKNPNLELQQYVEVPICTEEMKCFEPTPESMKIALDMFIPKEKNVIKCISRTALPEKFPSHNLPEVALLGQSNSGKSSLLKAIFNQSPELRIQTSKVPGSTKCLSFYEVGNRFCLVDMPGYGIRQPQWFQSSVMCYLKGRKNLTKAFILIDCRENFNSWDDAALQMVNDMKISFAVVLTKIDGVSISQRLKNFLHVRNMIVAKEKNCFPQIFMISSHTSEGLANLLAFIVHITGNLNVNS